MFNKGDLLICVDNTIYNTNWKGIKPIIGDYYTWRGGSPHLARDMGYVEEIISPMGTYGGVTVEWPHSVTWYRKIEDDVNIEKLMQSQLETA